VSSRSWVAAATDGARKAPAWPPSSVSDMGVQRPLEPGDDHVDFGLTRANRCPEQRA
jgi:hypothetical protein